MLNVLGLHHMLECARQKETKRIHAKYMVHRTVEQVFLLNNPLVILIVIRCESGYPESKQAGEALCQAYVHQ